MQNSEFYEKYNTTDKKFNSLSDILYKYYEKKKENVEIVNVLTLKEP